MSKIDRKIRELRRRRNLTQGEFAQAIGVKQSTVSRWESGAQEPEFSAVLRIAEWAGINAFDLAHEESHQFDTNPSGSDVKVIGLIKANEWRENHLFDDDEVFEVVIPLPSDFIHSGLEGFVVADKSCEPKYPENSVVFIMKNLGYVQHGRFVVVVRSDEAGLCETTLRETYVNRDGVVYLSPVTDDPSISAALRVKDERHTISDGYDEIDPLCIQGPVIASFIMEPGLILPF